MIDALLFELKQRFTDKNKDIMRGVQACNPTSSTFLDPKHLEPLDSTYCLDMDPVVKRILAVQKGRKIASLRIYVEMCIGRIKILLFLEGSPL